MDICGYDLQHHLSVNLTDFDFADLGARAFCVWREQGPKLKLADSFRKPA